MDNPIERMVADVRFLCEGIGPRPAGSPAENQAFIFVAERLQRLGFQPTWLEAFFAPLPFLSFSFLFVGLILLAGCILLKSFPFLAILGPLWLGLLPSLTRYEDSLRKRTAQTHNVYAQLGDNPHDPTLIFVAHVDTARAIPFANKNVLSFYSRTIYLTQRTAILAALIALLTVINLSVPAIVLEITRWIGAIIAAWFIISDLYCQLRPNPGWSPGANDNASGVAVALALAENAVRNKPTGLNLGFLFTGAEETGMHGADSFAQRIKTDYPNRKFTVISLDMVGAGPHLHYVIQEGGLFTRKTTPWVNAQLQQRHPGLTPIFYGIKSGDFSPFLSAGIPAAALQCGGSLSAQLRYHTVMDTMDGIDPNALTETLNLLTKIIQAFSYQNG